MVAELNIWESIAVVLGITYLILATREIIWCWLAAFFSTLIFLFLFWDATLIMQTGLQLYYLGMAVYGWWQWRGGASEQVLEVSAFRLPQHMLALALVVVATVISTALLHNFTDSALPLLDSFTSWGAVVTTWMVARKIIDNWLYWIIIDLLSAWLYLERGLQLTALLYLVYVVIAILGYREWKKQLPTPH
jgi:nicotinamide mononucleotide transporter